MYEGKTSDGNSLNPAPDRRFYSQQIHSTAHSVVDEVFRDCHLLFSMCVKTNAFFILVTFYFF